MRYSTYRLFSIALVCILSSISTIYIFNSKLIELLYWRKIPSTICQIDANCNPLHICLGGKCQRYFPSRPQNKTKCHSDCVDDLTLYEQKYYGQAIGYLIFLKGTDTSNCLIAYKQIEAISYENETYPEYNLFRIERREELKGWVLGLCRGI